MKNYITYDLINSPLRRCGNYGKANGCTDEQTAFGNYLYAIELLSGTYNHPNKVYAQGKIDMAKEFLENIANSYIDKENKQILFNEFNFNNSHMAGSLVSPLMPYVIKYVALKQGLNFNFAYGDDISNCQMFEVPPVTDEQMITSVVNTLNKERAKQIEENPELKNNSRYQPISLDKYVQIDKEM